MVKKSYRIAANKDRKNHLCNDEKRQKVYGGMVSNTKKFQSKEQDISGHSRSDG